MKRENTLETYQKLSRCYLREARSCLKSMAYRMAIIAAATGVHAGVCYRFSEKFHQNRMVKFATVIEELEKTKKYPDIIDDLRWLMRVRNSVAHPEEVLGTKLDSSGMQQIIDMIPDMPCTKKQLHLASMTNDYNSLENTAKKAIKKSKIILKKLSTSIECGDVMDWRTKYEQEFYKLTGRRNL